MCLGSPSLHTSYSPSEIVRVPVHIIPRRILRFIQNITTMHGSSPLTDTNFFSGN